MLMTDQAKLIRTSVADIRITGRNTQGVTIFKTASDEKVVSAVRIQGDMLEGDDNAEFGEDAIEGLAADAKYVEGAAPVSDSVVEVLEDELIAKEDDA
jgi:DNA gyrase subunit A